MSILNHNENDHTWVSLELGEQKFVKVKERSSGRVEKSFIVQAFCAGRDCTAGFTNTLEIVDTLEFFHGHEVDGLVYEVQNGYGRHLERE